MASYVGMQQLFVKNQAGRSVGVFVDFEEDVSSLADAFAEKEGYPLSLTPTSLRFVFCGRQLEPGIPLSKYGVIKGSTINAHVRLQSAPPAPAGLAGLSLQMRNEVLAAEAEEEKLGLEACRMRPRQRRTQDLARHKLTWVKIGVTIITPFAEIDGTLEFPQERWSSCKLSPCMLRSIIRVSELLGICTDGEESSWRLRLGRLCAFPCVQPLGMADVWKRLRSTIARIEVQSPKGVPLVRESLMTPLMNEEDEVCLGALCKEYVSNLHLSISLLGDAERAVDDLTVMFRETDETACRAEACCICLEPMAVGDMCRRLACLHSFHAGCAMRCLPETPACPVCRSSISIPSPMSSLPALPMSSPRRGSYARSASSRPPHPRSTALPSPGRQGAGSLPSTALAPSPPDGSPHSRRPPASRAVRAMRPLSLDRLSASLPSVRRGALGRPSSLSVPRLVKRALGRMWQ
mmetsp:Transcript_159145/g.296593  ORF Transcript_159145/g.296593 Transcript_159145/m.296593 type:complete len:463 (-) Transcript_159145:64-1452(-)